jgi:hypothetical protein
VNARLHEPLNEILARPPEPRAEAVECKHCHASIVFLPAFGWVSLDCLDDCYDMCPAEPFANHEPPTHARHSGQGTY